MNMDELLRYWPILIFIAQLLVSWALWSASKKFPSHKDVDSKIDPLSDHITLVDGRVNKLEINYLLQDERMKQLATRQEISEVMLALTRLDGKIETQNVTLARLEKPMTVFFDFLNKREKKNG